MKKPESQIYSLTPSGLKIVTVGLIISLCLCLAGFIIMLAPVTYESLQAVSSAMTLSCKVLVITAIIALIADIVGKVSKK